MYLNPECTSSQFSFIPLHSTSSLHLARECNSDTCLNLIFQSLHPLVRHFTQNRKLLNAESVLEPVSGFGFMKFQPIILSL